MTPVETAVSNGLTPVQLDHYLRNHCPLAQIATAHSLDVATVEEVMRVWGLAHLSGRDKSNVTLVREIVR